MDTDNRQEQGQRVCIQVQPTMSSSITIYDGSGLKYIYLIGTNQLFAIPLSNPYELEIELAHSRCKWYYLRRNQWDRFIKKLSLMSASLVAQLLSHHFDITSTKFVMGGIEYDICKSFHGLLVVQSTPTSLPDDIPCDNMLSDMLERYSDTIRRTMMVWINESFFDKR